MAAYIRNVMISGVCGARGNSPTVFSDKFATLPYQLLYSLKAIDVIVACRRLNRPRRQPRWRLRPYAGTWMPGSKHLLSWQLRKKQQMMQQQVYSAAYAKLVV